MPVTPAERTAMNDAWERMRSNADTVAKYLERQSGVPAHIVYDHLLRHKLSDTLDLLSHGASELVDRLVSGPIPPELRTYAIERLTDLLPPPSDRLLFGQPQRNDRLIVTTAIENGTPIPEDILGNLEYLTSQQPQFNREHVERVLYIWLVHLPAARDVANASASRMPGFGRQGEGSASMGRFAAQEGGPYKRIAQFVGVPPATETPAFLAEMRDVLAEFEGVRPRGGRRTRRVRNRRRRTRRR